MEYERQHWIPETYLSAWCDPDPARQNPRRVYRYRKSGSYEDYRPPSRIFSERELYTVPDSDGGRNLKTEHALTAIEYAYAKIRDRDLARRNPISGDARRDILIFIAALRVRSPEMRDHHAAYDARIFEIADATMAFLPTMTPKQLRKRPPSLASISGSQRISLEVLRRLAKRAFGETLPPNIVDEAGILDRMHLSVLMAPDGGETLITSDAPVVWWNPMDPPPSPRRFGLGHRAMEVTLPLTPTMCARITHRLGPDYVNIDAVTVDELNKRALFQCRKLFLSEKPSLRVEWLDEHE